VLPPERVPLTTAMGTRGRMAFSRVHPLRSLACDAAGQYGGHRPVPGATDWPGGQDIFTGKVHKEY